jgi:ubiquinone/menaquinone biosynthesis C-methylase UbiE
MESSQYFQVRNFSDYTYSKVSHFDIFRKLNYDIELYKNEKVVDPKSSPVKDYQDLLVFSYIKNILKPNSRILEVGGGNSRIINHFSHIHECWNIDKLEGCGNGPTDIDSTGFRLVRDYIGNFSRELPDDYFDLVFSISALEHVPEKDPQLFNKIKADIDRVLKPNGLSLHCLDVVLRGNSVCANRLLPFLFKEASPVNNFISFEELLKDPDVFSMSKETYDMFAKRFTRREYEEFGKLMSYNILWIKGPSKRNLIGSARKLIDLVLHELKGLTGRGSGRAKKTFLA